MANNHSPASVFREQLDELNRALPGVRDASDEGIHDARVATRRLREVLPLLSLADADRDRATRWLRKTGRRLGRVRDLDVMLGLALATINRLPAAAAALQHLLVELRRSRDAALRRAVKQLERDDGAGALSPVSHLRGSSRFSAAMAVGAAWRQVLADRILQRLDGLRSAAERAGGVKFPNRLHAVRIAAKKLRYALEVADDTRFIELPGGSLRRLKDVQDLLGDLHDRHVFLKTVADSALGTDQGHASAYDAVRAHAETESRDLHRRYLDERKDLLMLCHDTTGALRRSTRRFAAVRGPALVAVAGVLAIPPALRLIRRAG